MQSRKGFIRRLTGTLLLAGLALATALTAGGGANMAQAGTPTAGQPANPPKTYVLHVYFSTLDERDRLASELSAEEGVTTGGYLTVLADADRYNYIISRGLRFTIDEEQTKRLNDPNLRNTFYNGYKTVEEIYQFLDEKVAAYPNLVEKVDIGDSWCKIHAGSCVHPEPNNGYDLFVMHITNRNIAGPKPVFFVDAGIHSREIATPELLMRYINWLLDNYNSNADARWLVDYQDIWVMPTYNPDGHHVVEAGGGGNDPYMYRKNGNNSLGTCNWPPQSWNHDGIDLNRNFPWQWGCCGGSSGTPCSETYRGVSAGSEPETDAVTNKIRELIPDQRGPNFNDPAPITTTGVYQNVHTVANVNLVPYGYISTHAPNHNELLNIGAHMTAPDAGGNSYDYGTIWDLMYTVDGGSIDWAYGERGIAAVSTELGGGSFFPDYSCMDNPGCGSPVGLWPENKGMLIYLAKIARTPYLLSHGPDTNSVATVPMTVTQGTSVQLNATINFAWTGNTFSQNVGAAEYYIDTPPWAGGTAVAMQGTFGGSPTVPVQATIDTTGIPVGTHVIFVRGRGVNQYQGFDTWGPVSAAYLTITPGSITPTPTETPVPPTETPVPPTETTVPPTPCTISFTDVPTSDPFYTYIRCLACRGIVSGYSDSTFRPYNNITRGQISKVVSSAAGFNDEIPQDRQTYTDVPNTNTFWLWIERLTAHQVMSGYPCGVDPNEPCDPQNRPYFRWANNANRGQLAKIVANAAGITAEIPPNQQTFEDVPPSNPYWLWVERLMGLPIPPMQGYPCGGVGEPCGPQNRPYFRPFNNVTRGQASKIVAVTFLPNCQTPGR